MTHHTMAADAGGTTVSDKAVARTDFEGFFRSERDGLVRGLAFATGDGSLAAEAIDEAMARAFQRWERVGSLDRPAGWVYRVALNWSRSAWRKRRRVDLAATPPERAASDPESADPVLWQAVQALSTDRRDVVVLRYVLDWDQRQIATALNVPEGTVKSRLGRGLTELRNNLEVAK